MAASITVTDPPAALESGAYGAVSSPRWRLVVNHPVALAAGEGRKPVCGHVDALRWSEVSAEGRWAWAAQTIAIPRALVLDAAGCDRCDMGSAEVVLCLDCVREASAGMPGPGNPDPSTTLGLRVRACAPLAEKAFGSTTPLDEHLLPVLLDHLEREGLDKIRDGLRRLAAAEPRIHLQYNDTVSIIFEIYVDVDWEARRRRGAAGDAAERAVADRLEEREIAALIRRLEDWGLRGDGAIGRLWDKIRERFCVDCGAYLIQDGVRQRCYCTWDD